MDGEKIKKDTEKKRKHPGKFNSGGNAKNVKSGFRKRRVTRPAIEKSEVKGYDSNWEYLLHTSILKDWEIHTETIEYTVDHTYHPDFIKVIDGKKILLEAKGRFWDHAEYSKYVWIKKQLPENMELVFLFAEPTAAMPQAKRRKDGTKRTHSEWAESKGFRWYSARSIPKEWIDASSEIKEDPNYTLEVV
tara:strand:+ start:99 stop:668 length:570 start_codon:yes stop_codon:yes gene_type:complete